MSIAFVSGGRPSAEAIRGERGPTPDRAFVFRCRGGWPGRSGCAVPAETALYLRSESWFAAMTHRVAVCAPF